MDFLQALKGSFDGVVPQTDIACGDRVRSYDFAGNRECYAEGVVEDIIAEMEGCARYKLRVERRVFDGKEVQQHEDFVFPPVNGTPTWSGGFTNYVQRLAH